MTNDRSTCIAAVEDMLSDPIVVLMMRSDGVSPDHVRAICASARSRLAERGGRGLAAASARQIVKQRYFISTYSSMP